MEENNFYTVCNDILQEGNDDINTRGWRELHQLLILMFHAYNDNNDEWEVRVTGKSHVTGLWFIITHFVSLINSRVPRPGSHYYWWFVPYEFSRIFL